MPRAYGIFHLNLAYSSIPESSRREVLQRCYGPLLDLIESTGVPFGIELPSWTLRQIRHVDPQWVERFRALLACDVCELIGSGYVQLIGPLVPWEVNKRNQALGIEDYVAILGVRPRIAMVNEMAFSNGLVDLYAEAGYEGIVMDRDNVRLALGMHESSDGETPAYARGLKGASLPVLWSESIMFQKFQRYAHGDISLEDYLAYFRGRTKGDEPIPIYCNDAEIFDHRTGRFRNESAINAVGEWRRLGHLLDTLRAKEGVLWVSPSTALRLAGQAASARAAPLTSAAHPIPVKKQKKYNISRWAVTGRNDLWLNTMCHRLYRQVSSRLADDGQAWRSLCKLWASDLRTHITADRWESTQSALAELANRSHTDLRFGSNASRGTENQTKLSVDSGSLGPFSLQRSNERILLEVKSPEYQMKLNLRRGMTINSLAFRRHNFVPCIGTLPQGYFKSIELGADYYSGGVIVELPADHRRVTDLERVEPEVGYANGALSLKAVIESSCGRIIKTIVFSERDERISLYYEFPGWKRPHGTVRACILTLLAEEFSRPLIVETVNGGELCEHFELDRSFDHTIPSSVLVTCSTGLGATTGELVIGDDARKVKIEWDPSACALFPMLVHLVSGRRTLVRVLFSLAELDETTKPEGDLPGFCVSVSPFESSSG